MVSWGMHTKFNNTGKVVLKYNSFLKQNRRSGCMAAWWMWRTIAVGLQTNFCLMQSCKIVTKESQVNFYKLGSTGEICSIVTVTTLPNVDFESFWNKSESLFWSTYFIPKTSFHEVPSDIKKTCSLIVKPEGHENTPACDMMAIWESTWVEFLLSITLQKSYWYESTHW